MFKNKTENKIRNESEPNKSKYKNIEEAKYTEIKTKDEKEKLNNNGK